MPKSLVLTAIIMGLTGFLLGQWLSNNNQINVISSNAIEQALASNDSKNDKWSTPYVCPMHAEIVSDSLGSCPICGMDLVKSNFNKDASVEAGNALPIVRISPSVVHNLGVRTAIVNQGDLHRSIETIGKITRVDPMAWRTITPPIRGELVNIADKHDGDFIKVGDFLFSVKSEELFEYEKAFQDAFQSGDRATANAMIPQLSKMGLTPEQISKLQAGETPEIVIEVYAFEDAIVFTRRGFVGEKVHTGFTVFNVGGNYRVIEVTAEIFERQWSWVEEGQRAQMTVRGLPGITFEGEVVRIEPPVGYTTRSLEVGLRFKTDNLELSQSMFAHVNITGQQRKNVLMVPTDSVIRTGEGDRVVRVLGNNQFQSVSVVAGAEAGGLTEIRSGLKAGDKVVASGQFLIDSESNLLAGFRRLTAPGIAQSGTAQPDTTQPDITQQNHKHQQVDNHSPQLPAAGEQYQHSDHNAAPATQSPNTSADDFGTNAASENLSPVSYSTVNKR